MTQAQILCEQFRQITAPGSTANAWKWARRVTANLHALGNSTIGSRRGAHTCSVVVFRCEDGSRFAYDMNGASQVWAMPNEQAG